MSEARLGPADLASIARRIHAYWGAHLYVRVVPGSTPQMNWRDVHIPPEFETWSSGIHAQSGVTCADCHMPYIRQGAVKVSDHWLRSPLTDVNRACGSCHKQSEQELKDRIKQIQDKTAGLLRATEAALIDAIDAINAAQAAGATDEQLAAARQLHRRASLRWDFVSSENGSGFHSPQEAARVLANAIDFARQAQLAAERVTPKQ